MAATKKQLAALARGRATAAKNRAAAKKKDPIRRVSKVVKKAAPKKRVSSIRVVKSRIKPMAKPKYMISVADRVGKFGYLSSWASLSRGNPQFDSLPSKGASTSDHELAKSLVPLVKKFLPDGVKVKLVTISGKKK